jgi:hypothetical protein
MTTQLGNHYLLQQYKKSKNHFKVRKQRFTKKIF